MDQPTPETQIGPYYQSEENLKEAKRIIARWGALDMEAVNWKTHWQECYENIVPRKEDVTSTRMPGDRRDSDIYDTTGVLANEMLAAALHGMLTNPETRFFDIVFNDPKIADVQEVKDWCQTVGDILFRILNNTNFQTEIYEIYIDEGAIGTACLYMGEHEENIVHFSARAMKEIRIDENTLGIVDVVYYRFQWTPEQIINEFGKDKVHPDIVAEHEKGVTDKKWVIFAVEPMSKEEKKQDLRKFKFKSRYVLEEKNYLLSEGGFRECPFAVPRWSKTSGEKYGRGPGMQMLPDIMMLQAMMLTVIKGAQKTVDPPVAVEDDGVIGVVRLTPGGVTVVRPGSEPIKPLITDARIDFGQKMLEDVRSRIRAGFYLDQLQLKEGPQKTAEEVMQMKEDQMRLMGPVLGRQHFEGLRPIITRVYDLADKAGKIPEAPPIIQGKIFDVRYSSLIAKAQRMSEAQDIQRSLALMEPIAQLKPEVMDILKLDDISRKVWNVYGCDHRLLESPQEMKKIRAGQDKAKQQMAAQLQQQHQGDIAQKTAPMVSALQKGQPGVSQ